jgi:hypothetical protein
VEVLVVLVLLGWGYLALAASFANPASDPLVTKGVQQIVICGGSHKSGTWYKVTQEIPGGESGTWGAKKDGDCNVWLHYAAVPD